MKYTIARITPQDSRKFEITFSNGMDKETANIAALETGSWCLYRHSGSLMNFYSSVEDLISDIERDLNKKY